jgi:hypothetical protein
MLLVGSDTANSGPAPVSTWVVSPGSVDAIAVSGSTAYIGGGFDYVGPETGSFASLDPANGAVEAPPAIVDGEVFATVADGSGGFFIGGQFRLPGSSTSHPVAHVRADGSVDPGWQAPGDGLIAWALAVSDTTVYVGTSFGLMALDRTTGELAQDPWLPTVNGEVRALALAGSTLYVGGTFQDDEGEPKNLLAFDTFTGEPTSWSARTDDGVFALAVNGDTVYAGGVFATANGGTPRNGAAAFDGTTGAVTGWDPGIEPGGQVDALALSGPTVYLGGIFTTVADMPRDGLAAVSAADGTLGAWDPDPDPLGFRDVSAIVVAGSTVFAGGTSLAAYDVTSGHATAFGPTAGGVVDALAISGGRLGVGGEFRTIGSDSGHVARPLERQNLAAIDLTTGRPTAWAPSTGGTVLTLAISGSTVYAGGSIFAANHVPHDSLAAFDLATGALKPWSPRGYDGQVTALVVVGSTVYIGGQETNIGFPDARFRVKGVAAGTGATVWNGAEADGAIYALDAVGSTLVVGGAFTTLGGVARNRLAALPLTGPAVPTSWNPDVEAWVMTLAHSGSVEYAGGFFDSVNGDTTRHAAAAFALDTGAATPWDPNPGAARAGSLVLGMQPSASTMYMSGYALQAVSPDTGAPLPSWQAPFGYSPAIALTPYGLVFGGKFGLVHVPPDAPTAVSASAGDGSATVGFTPPAYDGGNTIGSYTVTSSGGQTATGTGSPIVVHGLTNGTAYSFTVTASNDAGSGAASAASDIVYPGGSGRPHPPAPEPASRPDVPDPPASVTRVPPPPPRH